MLSVSLAAAKGLKQYAKHVGSNLGDGIGNRPGRVSWWTEGPLTARSGISSTPSWAVPAQYLDNVTGCC
jgi:hypothetical protein